MRTFGVFTMSVAFCILSIGGCSVPDSAARIAALEQAVTAARAAVTAANADIATLQTQLAGAQQAGADAATLARIQTALATATQYAPQAQAVLTAARDALEQAKTNPGPAAEVDVVSAIISAVTSQLGPTATAYGSIATMVLGVIGTVLYRRKAVAATTQAASVQTDLATTQKAHADTYQTLGMVTKAIESLPPEQQAPVKAAVAVQMIAGSPHNEIIDASKT
jgi:hypothetical protein